MSPTPADNGVWIYQEAWFHVGDFDKDQTQTYEINKAGNGVYTFVIEGEVTISGEKVASRDAIGIWNTQAIEITAESDCRFLVMDVPMIS